MYLFSWSVSYVYKTWKHEIQTNIEMYLKWLSVRCTNVQSSTIRATMGPCLFLKMSTAISLTYYNQHHCQSECETDRGDKKDSGSGTSARVLRFHFRFRFTPGRRELVICVVVWPRHFCWFPYMYLPVTFYWMVICQYPTKYIHFFKFKQWIIFLWESVRSKHRFFKRIASFWTINVILSALPNPWHFDAHFVGYF